MTARHQHQIQMPTEAGPYGHEARLRPQFGSATRRAIDAPGLEELVDADGWHRLQAKPNQDFVDTTDCSVGVADGVTRRRDGTPLKSEVASKSVVGAYNKAVGYYRTRGYPVTLSDHTRKEVQFELLTDEQAKEMVYSIADFMRDSLMNDLQGRRDPDERDSATNFAGLLDLGDGRLGMLVVGDAFVVRVDRNGKLTRLSRPQKGVEFNDSGKMPAMTIDIIHTQPGDRFAVGTDGVRREESAFPGVTYDIDDKKFGYELAHAPDHPAAGAQHILDLTRQLHYTGYRNPDHRGDQYFPPPDDATVGVVYA